MAAPDRMDRVPNSDAFIPYRFSPSWTVHEFRSNSNTCDETISFTLSPSLYAHTGMLLSSLVLNWDRTLLTTRTQDFTGQRVSCPVLLWERLSILVPFFWSEKQMVTNVAFSPRPGSVWSTTLLHWSRNTTSPRVSLRVLPGLLVRQNSHTLIAKKYPPTTKSAVCCAQSERPLA